MAILINKKIVDHATACRFENIGYLESPKDEAASERN
jgi:hypothetical protein